MPRYFFHLVDGGARIIDQDGEELASPSEAERHARLVAWELAKNAKPGTFLAASIVLVDQQGSELLSVPLHGATEPRPR
jgi:hypothetical protein